jgi:bifunctional N-acetylglucosamine-1-phosphate-uridyltransferase/glucosamine-1-phosphate-acetyltransferase GlmU-like protein
VLGKLASKASNVLAEVVIEPMVSEVVNAAVGVSITKVAMVPAQGHEPEGVTPELYVSVAEGVVAEKDRYDSEM